MFTLPEAVPTVQDVFSDFYGDDTMWSRKIAPPT